MVQSKKEKAADKVLTLLFILLALFCVVPILYILSASLSDEIQLTKEGYSLLPRGFSLEAYKYILESPKPIINAYGVTILVTLGGTAVSLLVTTMLAYVIARKDFKVGRVFAFMIFFSMLFNGGLVPTYLVYTNILHIKDTLWALIVPTLLLNGFNTILVKNYFTYSVPYELREAASIDGASEYGTFFKIIMPISRPILATIGLMTGLMYWNDWQNGLYYLDDKKLYGIQNILNAINDNVQYLLTNAVSADTSAVPWIGVRMAIAVIGVLPILIVYPFFQEYFVKGITFGAVKG